MFATLISIMDTKDSMNTILTGVISTLIATLIIGIITAITTIIKKKFNPPPPPQPSEQPIYLSKPQKSFQDICRGRYDLLQEVYHMIHDSIENHSTPKRIAIIGEEGVGKSHFCYTLFHEFFNDCPIYLGWVDSYGKISIFDIIKKTFEDSRFHKKRKVDILAAFKNLGKPCILFVDEIDLYSPFDELEELANCPNIFLILSGTFRELEFIDRHFIVTPFDDIEIVKKIFEVRSKQEIAFLKPTERHSVETLLNRTRGNPFLIIAVAEARYHYHGRWSKMLENVEKNVYSDHDYLKTMLKQLFKIDDLNKYERDALSKLSIIGYERFVKAVFELLDIPEACVVSLCNTYWLKREDSVLYSMTDFRRQVIAKVLTDKYNLENAIEGLCNSLFRWGANKDKGFRWVSLYVENILKQVKGYAVDLLEKEIFSDFSFIVAAKYETIDNSWKQLEWIQLCKNCRQELEYQKAFLELRSKTAFVGILFSFSDVKNSYLDLEKKIVASHDCDKIGYFTDIYCLFLINFKQYDEVISRCQDYFSTYNFDLSNKYNCGVFLRYLQAANHLEDEETLRKIVNDEMIQELYQNDKVTISAAWCFSELGSLYKKRGNLEASERYIRHMVILINEERCFFHDDIKYELKFSDEEFAEYMHSCEELSESLEAALQREDAEALYIEGRYQEKHGNYEEASIRYEEAAYRDSLRGMCSLALLYYRGQGKKRDYEMARKYWEYCCDREHRGSHYWLGILLLDESYPENDREKALEHLKTAADMGSERAKKKLENM